MLTQIILAIVIIACIILIYRIYKLNITVAEAKLLAIEITQEFKTYRKEQSARNSLLFSLRANIILLEKERDNINEPSFKRMRKDSPARIEGQERFDKAQNRVNADLTQTRGLS